MENKRFEYYISLLDKSYTEVVRLLLKKYGLVTDDYFRENSYKRFLNGEIKSITHGKYKKTYEGLYTHHIDEICVENLANKDFIRKYRYAFDLQRKERLVYADLIEHLILHALITKETKGKYGYNGYYLFIEPMVKEWYTTDMVPKPDWMKSVYKRSFLRMGEVNLLLRSINIGPLSEIKTKELINSKVRDVLANKISNELKKPFFELMSRNSDFTDIFNETVDYLYEKEIKEYDRIEACIRKKFEKYLLTSEEIEWKKLEEKQRFLSEQIRREELLQSRKRFWHTEYPKLFENDIWPDTKREKILRLLFEYEKKEFMTFKQFKSLKINTIKDDLLIELEKIYEKKE
ncbi:hypothetical protein [Liquorilactobacillus hordei]|uniref:hypothetical protein n=1 Tax=Liquorilactobacillus hordei TaxID=468911 RepID=UPI001CBF10C1|nr:hypothetical protein [Liquorilactobacillus hordei]